MRKKIFWYFMSFSLLLACSNRNGNAHVNESSKKNDTTTTNSGTAIIKFTEDTHDFGTIKEGEIVKHSFLFKNEGNAPLVITEVTASCGCTASDYPKKAVNPSQSAYIDVKFDSKGKMGIQSKTINVFTNTENHVYTLKIQAIVEPNS